LFAQASRRVECEGLGGSGLVKAQLGYDFVRHLSVESFGTSHLFFTHAMLCCIPNVVEIAVEVFGCCIFGQDLLDLHPSGKIHLPLDVGHHENGVVRRDAAFCKS